MPLLVARNHQDPLPAVEAAKDRMIVPDQRESGPCRMRRLEELYTAVTPAPKLGGQVDFGGGLEPLRGSGLQRPVEERELVEQGEHLFRGRARRDRSHRANLRNQTLNQSRHATLYFGYVPDDLGGTPLPLRGAGQEGLGDGIKRGLELGPYPGQFLFQYLYAAVGW